MKYYLLFYSLIIIIIFTIIILINKIYQNNLKIIQFKFNNCTIPHIMFKTGPFNNNIPNEIKRVIQKSALNLNCKVKYFNDHDCRNFIKNNYHSNILKAYDSLIPTAYKADLWRYCILYKYGGVYSDLTQEILKPLSINKSQSNMILVKDRPECNHINNIQISFMATCPKNNFFLFLINNLTKDILNKRKGSCPLDVTGPVAFGRYFCKFFEIKVIPHGINNFIGQDNIVYRINIPYYMKNADYINEIKTDKHFIKNKIKDHVKLIYKSNNHGTKNKNKYHYQWNHNIIFK